MTTEYLIEDFDGKKIVLKGVGKMFYQDGFPISISVSEFKKKGIEVSILHVADECLKNGWSAKTTLNKLKADFQDDIDGNKYDLKLLEKFCFAEYEKQRKMIFNYLFKSKDDAMSFIKNKQPT